MKQKINQETINLAAIDIGSNAARILIKSVELVKNKSCDRNAEYLNPRVKTKKLQFLRIPLRLGMDVFDVGRISELKEIQLIKTIKIFRQLLFLYDVEEYRACATAAFREAKNGKKILHRIHKDTDINIDIITGNEEAKIIRNDTIPADDGNYLYMDVGGGSTEISLISKGKLVSENSFNIGTIRLLKEKITADQWHEFEQSVRQMVDGYNHIKIIGSGGNINKLYRLAAKGGKKGVLPITSLNKLYLQLSEMSVEERMATYDLRQDRADVIVPAAKLFLTVAEISQAEQIQVPVVGLADGIINSMIDKIYRGV